MEEKVIFSHLIGQVPSPNATTNKVLVLAHREELIDQAYRHLCSSLPQKSVDIEQGKRQASPDADVVVASVPTLGRKYSSRIERFDPNQFKLIVIDEAHHSSATSYLRVLGHFNALLNDETLPIKNKDGTRSDILVWGCTGTLQRSDGVGFGNVYEQVSYSRTLFQMWEEKWLAPINAYSIHTDADLSKVAKNQFDFVVSQLVKQINTPERNNTIVKAWLNHKDNFKSTLVFSANRQHAKDLTEAFRLSGKEAHLVDGQTPSDDRAELVSNFKEQKFPVMINCGVFTEGTDIPCIDCIILARPTRSSTLFQQMVGRGLRTFPDKEYCTVFDCFDNFSGCDIVTLPSLVGLPPNFNCEGQDLVKVHHEMQSLSENNTDCYHASSLSEAREMSKESVMGHSIDYPTNSEIDPAMWNHTNSSEPKISPILFDNKEINKVHYTMWRKFYMQIRKDSVWGLSLNKNSIYVLKNGAGNFDVFVHIVDRSSCKFSVLANHESSRSVENYYHVMTSASASTALKCGIVTGERLVGRTRMMLSSPNASWRSQPATYAQVKLIKRLSLGLWKGSDQQLTKGKAAAIMNGFFLRKSFNRLETLLQRYFDEISNYAYNNG
ncbi:uncharacterized protein TRIADDRAFT_55867 [Trichoplax adhaerens]|uniref:Helicase C-terminal domain-containing protein n=1 Tax=Trichoplax adhaerens TaxID=10228 RepID=B3RW31_TRIAD|nr:hypothetical protein TRIADDRAFT_55867 [Trichoplax adhaerens]EDV25599.1 hypothetical protein TRIADDRAFT_55867 [Trichoplax adhaerens]|eukprot:XP_002111632.1 hypothetical protein TRIADDRAFT_55867 [Trichoplax adhaerens]